MKKGEEECWNRFVSHRVGSRPCRVAWDLHCFANDDSESPSTVIVHRREKEKNGNEKGGDELGGDFFFFRIFCLLKRFQRGVRQG